MVKVLIPVVVVAAGWAVYGSLYSTRYEPKISLEPIAHEQYDPNAIEREIKFHEKRVQGDPKGAIGWAMLSGAYLAKSREQDDDVSSWKAEDAARKSLAVRRRGNAVAATRLVQALLEQHRFQDALKATEDALRISPADSEAQKLRADVLIELGRFEQAEAQLARVQAEPNDPTMMAIEARSLSGQGRHEEALKLLWQAYKVVKEMAQMPETTLAWYEIKIGTELLALSRPGEAEKSFLTALEEAPKSYKATIGMAEAALQEKRYAEAVQWCDETLKMVRSFKAMALRGDALAALGEANASRAQYEQIRALFLEEDQRFTKLGKGGPLHVRHPDREFAAFSARTGLFLREGLTAAKRDLQNRPDPQAKQTLAKIQGQLSEKA